MKKQLIILTMLIINSITASAQSQINDLLQKGYKLHDQGKYREAIEIYKAALKVEPQSSTIKYEMALSYMYAKDYPNAVKFSSEVIAMNDQNLLKAYNIKASALDNSKKSKEAIEVYNEALQKFSTDYLLHYNLALTYFNFKQYNKSAESAIKALQNNSGHASSHLLLGYSMYHLNNKVPSILSLDYFLLLEPNTDRSRAAISKVLEQFKGNVDKKKSGQINVYDNSLNKEFSAAELFISLLATSNTSKKNKTEVDLFAENTSSFFKMLGESNKGESKDVWRNSYIPFFYQLAQSPHMEAYSRYITQSIYPESKKWIPNNIAKVKALANWVKNGGK